jgi:hypothetical protein
MNKFLFIGLIISVFGALLLMQVGCTQEVENKTLSQEEMIALGEYIVSTNGCDDCHTPKIFTENGPVFDTTRALSGTPGGEVLPSLDVDMIGPDKWIATDKHLGTWVGPWGISYSANLTLGNFLFSQFNAGHCNRTRYSYRGNVYQNISGRKIERYDETFAATHALAGVWYENRSGP